MSLRKLFMCCVQLFLGYACECTHSGSSTKIAEYVATMNKRSHRQYVTESVNIDLLVVSRALAQHRHSHTFTVLPSLACLYIVLAHVTPLTRRLCWSLGYCLDRRSKHPRCAAGCCLQGIRCVVFAFHPQRPSSCA